MGKKLFGVPRIKLEGLEIKKEVIDLVTREVAERHSLIPVKLTDDHHTIIIAMANPMNLTAMDDVKFLTGYDVEVRFAGALTIRRAINLHYPPAPPAPASSTPTSPADLSTEQIKALMDMQAELQREVGRLTSERAETERKLATCQRKLEALSAVIEQERTRNRAAFPVPSPEEYLMPRRRNFGDLFVGGERL